MFCTRGKNPACTLRVCAMHCVRMPQIAFEWLPLTADVRDVCVCACVCGMGWCGGRDRERVRERETRLVVRKGLGRGRLFVELE